MQWPPLQLLGMIMRTIMQMYCQVPPSPIAPPIHWFSSRSHIQYQADILEVVVAVQGQGWG